MIYSVLSAGMCVISFPLSLMILLLLRLLNHSSPIRDVLESGFGLLTHFILLIIRFVVVICLIGLIIDLILFASS